jgi:alpha-L-arabinofuranosidase
VVNRHRDQSIETEIVNQSGQFAKDAVAYEVNASDPKAQNGPTNQSVKTVQKDFNTGGGRRFVYSFPPHSFTLIKAKVLE